jgi:hypothetical protein
VRESEKVELMDIVTGEKFISFADTVVCNVGNLSFHKNLANFTTNEKLLIINTDSPSVLQLKLKNNSIIFCYPHVLKDFLHMITQFPVWNITLITHNSDDNMFTTYSPEVQKLAIDTLNSNIIKKWYAQNVAIIHPKLYPLPIGIANSMWPHGNLEKITSINNSLKIPNYNIKTRLLYCNFSLKTNPIIRTPLKKLLELKKFKFDEPSLPWSDYLHELSKSKFCICPIGNGLDSHRVWEAIYVGCIPIVEDILQYAKYIDIPIVRIKNWNDITVEFLNTEYDKLIMAKKQNLWNLSYTNMNYYRDLITSK